jgi:hypothetical protein
MSRQTRFHGDVFENAVRISKENALAQRADEKILIAIVVEIANSGTHSIHFACEAGRGGDIGECSIAIVAEEFRRGCAPPLPRPVFAIGEEQVLPSIAVVVDE